VNGNLNETCPLVGRSACIQKHEQGMKQRGTIATTRGEVDLAFPK